VVKPSRLIRPRLEVLEDRCMPATFVVTNLSGDVNTAGSLPYEVSLADGSGTPATVTVTPGLSGTIPLVATLVLKNTVSQPITIDGSGANITVSGQGTVEDFSIGSNQNATINDLTITGGSQPGQYGGGIHNAGSLILTNCTVTGNSAPAADGGGIFSNGTQLLMINDTVTGNSAELGGGIDIYTSNASATLINCTVANNTVTGPSANGGGIYIHSVPVTVLNTIVYNPKSGAATQNDVFGTITQAQGDLFGTAPTILVGGDLGDNQLNNPSLGPLQNNGGPTPTMALQNGSPAIANGASTSAIPGVSVPATDQRGDPRPANSIDIGAFQSPVSPSPSPSPSPILALGPTPGSSGPAFDPDEVAFDALLMADGLLENNGLFVYLGWVDYSKLLGRLDSADQALAQAQCYHDFSWYYSYISWDITWNN
jgi:hypothetical protein